MLDTAADAPPLGPAPLYQATPDAFLRQLAMGEELLDRKAQRHLLPMMAAEILAHRAMINDPVGQFLATSCVVTGFAKDRLPAVDLAEGLQLFCEEAGHTAPSFVTATRQIAQRSLRWRHPVTGRAFLRVKRSRSEYSGLRFTPDFQQRLALWRA